MERTPCGRREPRGGRLLQCGRQRDWKSKGRISVVMVPKENSLVHSPDNLLSGPPVCQAHCVGLFFPCKSVCSARPLQLP